MRRALGAVRVDRLARRIEELGAIGRTPSGGVTRLGLSGEEEAAKALVASWLAARGALVRRDEAANLLARVGGDGDPIVVGSHLDSVPDGGRYDGHLGVLVAVELVEALADAGLQPPPLEIVAWTDEEGARFGVGLFGSAAAYGWLPPSAPARADRHGITVSGALRALGLAGDPARARRSGDRAYLEAHIEQGPRLDRARIPLGVVGAIVGVTHARVTVEGAAGHAGTTEMAGRRDALVGAAELILALETAARAWSPAVATVGEVAVLPGAKNVVPGTCVFSVDVRAPDEETRRTVLEHFEEARHTLERSRGVRTTFDLLSAPPPTGLDARLRGILKEACGELGLDAPELLSWAGHDAANPAAAGVPSAMLFIRSRNGSHNPREEASPEDAALAVKALLLAIERLA